MKNYLYISDTKLKLLSPQVHKNWIEHLTSRLKLSVGGVEAEFSLPIRNAAEQASKLERVSQHILQNELDKGSWRHMTLDVRRAHLIKPNEEFFLVGRIGGGPTRSEIVHKLQTQKHLPDNVREGMLSTLDTIDRVGAQYILLSGSAHHVVGAQPASDKAQLNLSHFYVVEQYLSEYASTDWLATRGSGEQAPAWKYDQFLPGISNRETASIIANIQQNFEPPTFKIETLALKIFEHPVGDRGSFAYIFSPLYAAYA